MILGENFFSKYKTREDFDRERQEFEARKRIGELQTMQLEKQVMQPEQLSPEQLIAKSIQLGGIGGLSPQEQAQLQAYDVVRTSTMAQNPLTGGIYAKHGSILDRLPGQINNMPTHEAMGAPTGRPDLRYTTPINPDPAEQPNYTPTQADAIVNDIFTHGDQLPTDAQNGAPTKTQPVDLYRGNQPVVPQPTITQPDTTGLYLPGQQSVLEEKAKLEMQQQAQQQKAQRERDAQIGESRESLRTLQMMKAYNKGTLEIPYAEAAQPATRLFNEKAAANMAQLLQLRLKLAAPLAKQLGVNPTDKDFENTLNQIFNANENRNTRDAQIDLLAKITQGQISPPTIEEFDAMLRSISNQAGGGEQQSDPLGIR